MTGSAPYGVYGVAVQGVGVEAGGRPAPPPSWEAWTVSQHTGPADDGEGMEVTGRRARIGMPGAGELRLDRAARTVVFALRRPVSAEAILHPGLVPAAAVIAWWMDRVPVHAAAVVLEGRAWGLLADREGGKSTTAALLSDGAPELLTDDLLVVEGERCFAGPGSVDLRPAAAARLGGIPLGRIGQRERFRKPFAGPRLEAPLAGWVELAWSGGGPPAVVPVPVGERIAALARHASLPLTGEQLLDLAAAPMLRFTRPRSLADAHEHVAVLAAALAQAR